MPPLKKYIGIDGGGTKTLCVIGNETGEIEAVVSGKSSNIQSRPLNDVKEILHQLIDSVMVKTNTDPVQLETVYLSLAGCGRVPDQQRVYEALRPLVAENTSIIVVNDAMGALAAGTWGEPGVVLIAGTGSIAYALDSPGNLIRVGGWGYLLGDEGSGYDIGRKGLSAVLKQFDGRGGRSVLTDHILRKLNLSTPEELISFVYGSENARVEIAALTKVVFAAAEDGDAVANTIVEGAVHELVELAETACNAGNQHQLVVGGGLFNNDFFREKFLGNIRPDLVVRHPSLPPAAGAFILALKATGISLTAGIKDNIVRSWKNRKDEME